MEFVHHLVANFRTLDLPLPLLLEIDLDAVDDLLNEIDTDGPLLAGLFQTIEDFEAVEDLSPPVLLDHHGKGFLCSLAGGKSLLTAEAFPPSPNGLLILAKA